MSEYVWGVLTPFIAIGGLVLIVALAYLILKLALWLNSVTHTMMFDTIHVKRNRADPFGTQPERPEYFDAATEFRDAIVKSPKIKAFRGLGHYVFIVRAYREVSGD